MKFNKNYELLEIEDLNILNFEGEVYKPSIRKLIDIKHLYYFLEKAESMNPEIELYYVFRDIKCKDLEKILKEEDLRIDLTVMNNVLVGDEYNKTHGHYHPEASPGRSFPEIYQVIRGKVLFLLQKCKENILEDFIIVEANEGDTVIIPPNYGHNMVNTFEGISITINLVSSRFIPLYSRYKKFKGSAFYILKENNIIPNKNYIINLKPRFLKTKIKNYNLFSRLIDNKFEFKFLNWPYEIDNYFKFYEEESI